MTIWSSLVYSKFLIDDPQVLIHCPQFLIDNLQLSIHDEKNLAIISEGLHIILVLNTVQLHFIDLARKRKRIFLILVIREDLNNG